jgi:anti-sigma factor RsiW
VLHADRKPQLGPIAEEQIIATLLRPLTAEETHQRGNDNRERELQAIFVELSPLEALALRRRLDADRHDDHLVVEFRRLNIERRQRLKDFLCNPRRGAKRCVNRAGY